MKNISKIFTVIILLLVSVLFGDMVRKIYFTKDVKKPVLISSDTLPLENEGSIEVRLVGDKKVVVISFGDLQYVATKKKRMKETVSKLEALFERLK